MNDVVLSVLLYARNSADCLERATLDALALLPQLTPHYELVLVDDASDDATATIADNLAAACEPVMVIHQPTPVGFAGALVAAASAASGTSIVGMAVGESHTEETLRRLFAARNLDLAIGYHSAPSRGRTIPLSKTLRLRESESGLVFVRTALLESIIDTVPPPTDCASLYRAILAPDIRWAEVEIAAASNGIPNATEQPLVQRALIGTGLAALAGGVWFFRKRMRP